MFYKNKIVEKPGMISRLARSIADNKKKILFGAGLGMLGGGTYLAGKKLDRMGSANLEKKRKIYESSSGKIKATEQRMKKDAIKELHAGGDPSLGLTNRVEKARKWGRNASSNLEKKNILNRRRMDSSLSRIGEGARVLGRGVLRKARNIIRKTAKEKDIEKKRRSLNPYNYGHAASFTGIPFAGSITRELLFKNREKELARDGYSAKPREMKEIAYDTLLPYGLKSLGLGALGGIVGHAGGKGLAKIINKLSKSGNKLSGKFREDFMRGVGSYAGVLGGATAGRLKDDSKAFEKYLKKEDDYNKRKK